MPCNPNSRAPRPPEMLPPPWSLMDVSCTNTVLSLSADNSICLIAPRMVVETSCCSTAKRLPPPWLGIPVRVPHPTRMVVTDKSAMIQNVLRACFIIISDFLMILFTKTCKPH